MASKTKGGSKTARDLEQDITDEVIAAMEAGAAPWAKPWQDGGAASLPLRHNDEAYQGINTLILWMTAAQRGYSTPHWMTYKQAAELGGQVKKGEKGSTVIYAGVIEKERDDGETDKIPFQRGYAVFNAAQIEGLPERYYAAHEAAQTRNDNERRPDLDSFFASSGVPFYERGNQAFYDRSADAITLPPLSAFKSSDSYYQTLAHEAIHSTGAPSRLNREKGGKFGDAAYAREELVAELGSAFLMARLGVQPDYSNHAAYLNGWIRALKDDKRVIFRAAAGASKATSWLNDAATEKGAALAWPTSEAARSEHKQSSTVSKTLSPPPERPKKGDRAADLAVLAAAHSQITEKRTQRVSRGRTR